MNFWIAGTLAVLSFGYVGANAATVTVDGRIAYIDFVDTPEMPLDSPESLRIRPVFRH